MFILGASLIDQLVKNLPAMQETLFDSWVWKIWRRDRLPTAVFLVFPCDSAGKESACNAGELNLILGLGRSPGKGKSYPLQYSCLENSIDRGTWWAHIHKDAMDCEDKFSIQIHILNPEKLVQSYYSFLRENKRNIGNILLLVCVCVCTCVFLHVT